MEYNQSSFIKTDDNKVINEKHIRWIKKIGECLEVCTRANGCVSERPFINSHTICKLNNPISYNRLNKYFD